MIDLELMDVYDLEQLEDDCACVQLHVSGGTVGTGGPDIIDAIPDPTIFDEQGFIRPNRPEPPVTSPQQLLRDLGKLNWLLGWIG